uniref:Uncharacterized protein n=1 Tax=Pygocentrus nattereri TaxID=42514 RepID=A0AAR2JWE8_PYGNA
MAERGVQTVKLLLKKAKADGKDPYLSLLNLRNTPLEDLGASPAQLLMGRRTKTRLPTPPQLLEPRTIKSKKRKVTASSYTQHPKTQCINESTHTVSDFQYCHSPSYNYCTNLN